MALQAGEFIFYDGRPDLECGAPESRGSCALRRVYQCQDGKWIFLAIGNEWQWSALCDALGKALAPGGFSGAALETADGDLAARLAQEFADYPCDTLLTTLIARGIPAAPVNPAVEVFDQPQIKANELDAELNHPELGPVAQNGILLKFASTPCAIRSSAPMLGQHTRQVMAEFGYSAAQIEELARDRVIMTR
jgi:crotonobetainyl-CoA:carnitine CoA-transferase CaiB-like acyl-CoA transferase